MDRLFSFMAEAAERVAQAHRDYPWTEGLLNAKDPSSVAQRWAQGLANAGQKITDGVNAVTVAPGALAAAQSAVWVQRTTASQAKFARNVAAVGLNPWQQSVINKGIPRLASGAAQAEPKMVPFYQKLLPYVASGRASLPKRGDINANKARMNAWVDYMAKFQK